MSEKWNSGDIPHAVVLPDDFRGYSHDDFQLSPMYRDYIDTILIPNGMIKDRLDKMAFDILSSLNRRSVEQITFVCVLKGGYKFAADLLERLENAAISTNRKLTIRLDFVVASTYVNDRVAHDTRIQICGNPENLLNKDLLIVEDLVDTGTTLRSLFDFLKQFRPNSIELASLLIKRCSEQQGVKPHYVGFEVPDRFIVGYAIDYNDHFRGLPHICVVNDEGKKQFMAKQ